MEPMLTFGEKQHGFFIFLSLKFLTVKILYFFIIFVGSFF